MPNPGNINIQLTLTGMRLKDFGFAVEHLLDIGELAGTTEVRLVSLSMRHIPERLLQRGATLVFDEARRDQQAALGRDYVEHQLGMRRILLVGAGPEGSMAEHSTLEVGLAWSVIGNPVGAVKAYPSDELWPDPVDIDLDRIGSVAFAHISPGKLKPDRSRLIEAHRTPEGRASRPLFAPTPHQPSLPDTRKASKASSGATLGAPAYPFAYPVGSPKKPFPPLYSSASEENFIK